MQAFCNTCSDFHMEKTAVAFTCFVYGHLGDRNENQLCKDLC